MVIKYLKGSTNITTGLQRHPVSFIAHSLKASIKRQRNSVSKGMYAVDSVHPGSQPQSGNEIIQFELVILLSALNPGDLDHLLLVSEPNSLIFPCSLSSFLYFFLFLLIFPASFFYEPPSITANICEVLECQMLC